MRRKEAIRLARAYTGNPEPAPRLPSLQAIARRLSRVASDLARAIEARNDA
jgi:hypothetical protein